MKTQNRWSLKVVALLLWIPVALPATPVHDDHGQNGAAILTVDHFVSHISTVPANQGEQVKLFVRERVKGDRHDKREGVKGDRHDKRERDKGDRHDKPVVLMVNEATHAVVVSFDVRFENYSWMAFLAEAGFDVFAVDLTGYGSSPKPEMDDPCNTTASQQRLLLIPNPIPGSGPCQPSYPFRLTTSQSDWDEIDTIVDHIRQLRDVEKVNLIGYSRGGARMGGYAARHPEKVERLFLYAPAYFRAERSGPPEVLPEPGVPMTVLRTDVFPGWDAEVKCQNQFTSAIRPVVTSARREFDPLGSTWGPGQPPAGVWRAPAQNTRWGWNPTFAKQVKTPALLIRGDLDTSSPAANVSALYEDLGSEQKVFVHVACASHFFVWENQHMILLRASEEWLRHGTFAGQQTGSFFVNSDGQVHRE